MRHGRRARGTTHNPIQIAEWIPVVITEHALLRYQERAGKYVSRQDALVQLERKVRASRFVKFDTEHKQNREIRTFHGERFIVAQEQGTFVVITVLLNDKLCMERNFEKTWMRAKTVTC